MYESQIFRQEIAVYECIRFVTSVAVWPREVKDLMLSDVRATAQGVVGVGLVHSRSTINLRYEQPRCMNAGTS